MLVKIFLRLVRCLRCGKLQELEKFPDESKVWALYCIECKKTPAGEIPNG